MSFINVEIKAHCPDKELVEKLLKQQEARLVGEDHQVDTYYKVAEGRLKIRTGNIENSLIFYRRPNETGPKKSDISMYQQTDLTGVKDVLTQALSVWVVVDKKRRIYFIDNVKFHIDEVKDLGSFVEIEAIDKEGQIGEERLREQVDYYMKLLSISPKYLQDKSYSDMIWALSNKYP